MNSKRYLTNGYTISNNSYETRLNNNDLVCGATGCGKTRGYVIPNLRMAEQSMIVCDTKGVLYGEYEQELRQKGYEVLNIDLFRKAVPVATIRFVTSARIHRRGFTGKMIFTGWRRSSVLLSIRTMCFGSRQPKCFWRL